MYALAKDVAQGKRTELQAASRLQEKFGMNFSSAWGYLRKRKQMLNGERYTRTMNIAATRYFLENIYKDEGVMGLKQAVSSVRKHAEYYSQQGKSGLPSILAMVDDLELSLLSSPNQSTIELLEADFEVQVEAMLSAKQALRRSKLPPPGHKPSHGTATVKVYQRSAAVVAEVRLRSNGRCESCKKPAPFTKAKDGSPYLEVHHVIRLANGGDDTVQNAIAVCPNCHRFHHFGKQD